MPPQASSRAKMCIRDSVWTGKKTPQQALDTAVERGNQLLLSLIHISNSVDTVMGPLTWDENGDLKGFEFGVFAVSYTHLDVYKRQLRNWRIVKVETTKAQRKLFFNLRKTKQRLGWFNQDEGEMVARELGVTSKDVREMESRMAAQDMTFDLSSDDDSDKMCIRDSIKVSMAK